MTNARNFPVVRVGGITIVQHLSTPQQPVMPAGAIESGSIDFVLSPERIALKISEIASVAEGLAS